MIPATFDLAGTTWVVRLETPPDPTTLGQTVRDQATIYVNPAYPLAIQQSTFFHELVHAILYTTGKDAHDEEKVDLLGALFHQFVKTATYGQPDLLPRPQGTPAGQRPRARSRAGGQRGG